MVIERKLKNSFGDVEQSMSSLDKVAQVSVSQVVISVVVCFLLIMYV